MNTYTPQELAQTRPAADGKFPLIDLPYALDALVPVISATTLGLHHGKHLQGYVNNLNAAIAADASLAGCSLEEIVCRAEGGTFNNAGQLLNHNLYFLALRAPQQGNAPTGRLAEAIDAAFGSFDAFRKAFEQQGTSLFGSGWVWLAADRDGKLSISQERNADNPVTRGLRPLLCFDVWEHAYYVDYQNRRADHLAALWQVVDWDVVAQRYAAGR